MWYGWAFQEDTPGPYSRVCKPSKMAIVHFMMELSKLAEMFFEPIEIIWDTVPKNIYNENWHNIRNNMEIFVSTTSRTLSNIFMKICHDCKYFAYLMSPLQIVSSYLLSFEDRQNKYWRCWKVLIRSKNENFHEISWLEILCKFWCKLLWAFCF